MKEIWKDVVGFEGIYEVSNFGNVKSLDRYVRNGHHGKMILKGKTLKNFDRKGYKNITLWKDRAEYCWTVHRLVAISFIPNPNNYNQINHIDGNKSNNSIDNIEWCSCKQNINHAFDNDLMSINKNTKLIKVCDNSKHEFRSLSKASEFIGRNRSYIYNSIKNNRDIIGIDKNVYIAK